MRTCRPDVGFGGAHVPNVDTSEGKATEYTTHDRHQLTTNRHNNTDEFQPSIHKQISFCISLFWDEDWALSGSPT